MEELVTAYDNLSNVVDKHAPLLQRTITLRPHAPWYSDELRQLKHQKRKLERQWRRTKLELHHQMFRAKCIETNKELLRAKQVFYSSKILDCGRDQKALFSITRNLLQRKSGLPSHASAAGLTEQFAAFFTNKVAQVRLDLDSVGGEPHCAPPSMTTPESDITEFQALTENQVQKLVMQSPSKSCQLDPLPTWLLKGCLVELLPIITSIVNSSMQSGVVPDRLKAALVRPLLKKPGLDQEVLKNFRPVSNLSFISKVIEKAVAAQLKQHLMHNDLYDPVQSAYRERHSTETALMKVHDDILRALDSGSLVALVLLDLSAAFDTIDHGVLLTRLQERYGIRGRVLCWIRSYLSSRTWSVSIEDQQSKTRPLGYGVPQGSILGPLLFILYMAPLGDLIRSHGPDNHSYSDDNQLYCA